MINSLNLVEEIEKERQEMLSLSQKYSLTSPQVIESSQKLDDLLTVYEIHVKQQAI